MARFIFDIETDGFVDDMTVVHSLVLKDPDTGAVYSCTDHAEYTGPSFQVPENYQVLTLEAGLRLLQYADEIIGHNIIKFDIPAIQKIYPWFSPKGRVTDTLVLSRLIYPNLRDIDVQKSDTARRRGRKYTVGNKAFGSHALEPWGYRLQVMKGEYMGDEDIIALGGDFATHAYDTRWVRWNRSMQEYCEQDVVVTEALWRLMDGKAYSQVAIDLEHETATLMAEQERNGFPFDEEGAAALTEKLVVRRATLEAKLIETFGAWYRPKGHMIPKRSRAVKTEGGWKEEFTEGTPYTKIELVTFNPASRHHIADRLGFLYGWTPTEFTDKGQPKVDETILKGLPYPKAQPLAEYMLVQKRLGQVAEGKQAWLKVVKNGHIHGSVNPNGAVTGRATHAYPNVAQTPSTKAPYGKECRQLFRVRPGFKLLGSDASGLELRTLGHFMARFDDGSYIRLLLEGDVHWANVMSMGLCTQARDLSNKLHDVLRDGAKTFIYGFLYGAGDEKAGRIVYDIVLRLQALGLAWEELFARFFPDVDGAPQEGDFKRAGARLKKQFLAATPALKKLREAVARVAKVRGTIRGLDGRTLPIRHKHAALNTLLQSAGALICKRWITFIRRDLEAAGLKHGWDGDYAFVAWVHDEVQIAIRPELEEIIGAICQNAAVASGEFFNFRCPIAADYTTGLSWAETH